MPAKKKTIIFDLDGTLYRLKGGSYAKSDLKKYVLRNAKDFIASQLGLSKKDARGVLDKIQKKYGAEISLGLEKEYGINRYKYFNTVWDIPAGKVVRKDNDLRQTLISLSKKYRLTLVSDAPKVWINNVLKELKVSDIFKNNIFSGEGDMRKGFGNAYQRILKKYKTKPRDCISVGDQEKTDIIPAKKLGMITIFVNENKCSTIATFCIKRIIDMKKIKVHL